MNNIKFANGQFERRTPESQGIPSRAIRACLDQVMASGENVHSLHVFRHGYLVAGGCAKPFHDHSPRRVYSTMKTVIALAILFLVQEGKVTFEDKIVDYFPEDVPADCAPEIRALTLRNVLNMSVGQEQDALRIFHESNYGAGMIPFTARNAASQLDFDPAGMSLEQIFFSLPVVFQPGSRFHYVNTVPELLIRIVTKTSGTDFIHYLQPRLFEPLGIHWFNCQETWMDGWSPAAPARKATDPVIGYLDGATTVTTSEDLCKFALFLLQRGSWDGKQLLDPALVDEATAMHIPTDDWAAKQPLYNETSSYGYGMQIWRNPYGGYQLIGGSGQCAVVVPDQELVIVWTSMNSHLAERLSIVPNAVRDCIYKYLRAYPLDAQPEEADQMQRCFDSWSIMPVPTLAHRSSEAQRSGRYEAAEICDGITALVFDFEHETVTVEQGDAKCELTYGTDGNFVTNTPCPVIQAGGYSCVYGADKDIVHVCGGWSAEDENAFLLLLQYDCDMIPYYYTCVLQADGHMALSRRS